MRHAVFSPSMKTNLALIDTAMFTVYRSYIWVMSTREWSCSNQRQGAGVQLHRTICEHEMGAYASEELVSTANT